MQQQVNQMKNNVKQMNDAVEKLELEKGLLKKTEHELNERILTMEKLL